MLVFAHDRCPVCNDGVAFEGFGFFWISPASSGPPRLPTQYLFHDACARRLAHQAFDFTPAEAERARREEALAHMAVGESPITAETGLRSDRCLICNQVVALGEVGIGLAQTFEMSSGRHQERLQHVLHDTCVRGIAHLAFDFAAVDAARVALEGMFANIDIDPRAGAD